MLLLGATPAFAQGPRFIAAGAGAAALRVERPGVSGVVVLSGIAPGFAARIGGRVALEVAYAEGGLSADTGTAGDQDLVDGSVLVAFRALSWLHLKAGPHLVGFVTAGATEKWMRWEARARVESQLIPGSMRAHLEGWSALSTDVNVAAGGSGRGAEAGLTLQPSRSPISVRLVYGIDALELDGGSTSTIQSVAFSLRFGGSR